MAQDKVTSHDVARRAGVSRTTVSMVLNRSDAVALSKETRERVLQAASELGYRPNTAARNLARGNTETIGLVISDAAILPNDAFIPQLLHGIGQVNRRHGYHVLLEGLGPGTGDDSYESLAETRRIDGMIVLNPRTDDPGLINLIERDFPVVMIGSIRHPLEYSVNYATGAGIKASVDFLVGLGHRRIGTVSFSQLGFVATDVRLAAMRRALAGHGLPLDDADIEHAAFSAESGHRATLRLLERRPDLTAVLAGNDTIAIGVISAAVSTGRRVPNDLSVIGFDDLPFAAWLSPALTTVQVDAVSQGAQAAEILIRLLTGQPVENRQVRTSTKFIVRASCAPCGGAMGTDV